MTTYQFPNITHPQPLKAKEVLLVASGDLRLSANQTCWPAQEAMENKLVKAFSAEGYTVKRAHTYDPQEKHGFISSQIMGIRVFRQIPKDAPIIVAEAVWQYSYHVLAGLRDHQGPILTVANWDGQWPGLVGMLNLNASLTKMGVEYSTIWSVDFEDEFFLKSIRLWLESGKIMHETEHVKDLDLEKLPEEERTLGEALAAQLKHDKAVIGIFDEGCMGMYNGIIEDEMLNPMGLYKERMSQSALLAEMRRVSETEALAAWEWLKNKGMRFELGKNEDTELTEWQVLEQMKMYIAAVRMSDFFGCDAVGIQYQQGLKDMAPASDLVEGLLSNVERPPVYHIDSREELFSGKAVVNFNEVDEGVAVDSLTTNRIWTAMGMDPATTLHDIRYGEHYTGEDIDEFVWVFEISGSVPPSHFPNGYKDAISKRQDPMYFPLGGGTLSGVSKAGEIVWSRVFVMNDQVHADLGRGRSIELPEEETQRRLKATTEQWPIMHAVLYGVSRDQLMARHKSNHINVVYAPDTDMADKALAAKAAMLKGMGIEVHFCGDVKY